MHDEAHDKGIAMKPIENVVFDVGMVLYRWNLRFLFEKLIDDPQRLEWFVANVVTDEWHFEHDEGRELAKMVAERKAQFPDHAGLIDAYATRFVETIPGPVEGSLDLVRRLDEAGVPLWAITNFAAPFWAEFRATQPVFDRFRDIVVSGVERLIKPHPPIFQLAARRFGIAPETAWFIDDRLDNVEGAARLGWQVHHFRDAPTLEVDLVRRRLLRA
jgi:2-haloacid dehalogenase